MRINKKLISYNFNRGGNTKKYIVVHDTGNTSKGANAENHYKYFNGGNRNASAHYFVDDTQILHCVEDNDRAWHVGVKYGSAARPEVNNSNSIGVEICVNSDGNYQKAFKNTIALVVYLMDLYKISIDNVVTHHEACAKSCPTSMAANNWQLWHSFKQEIANELNSKSKILEAKQSVKFSLFGVKNIDIEGIVKDGTTYIKARDLLEAMDFIVDWDDNTKTVLVKNKDAVVITSEELQVLEKIVQAEAGGEDEKGKILVVNTIMNRVRSDRFPSDIKAVVFEPMQFEPTRNGAYDKAVPSAETKVAVQKALNGEDYSNGAKYFRTVRGATAESWHERELTRLFDWGGHRFYS